MLHADGTDCCHDGQPQATLLDEGGPLCPGGLPVIDRNVRAISQ